MLKTFVSGCMFAVLALSIDAHAQTFDATLHSLPVTSDAAEPEPRVEFMETVSGFPPAVQSWWSEGRTLGYELVYPRAQALRLAGRSIGSEGSTIAARTHEAEMIAALGPVALESPTTVQ